MLTEKQIKRKRHIDFLLSFFTDEPKFQVKEINGYVLTKFYLGTEKNKWSVALYTKESWKAKQDYESKNKSLF